MKKIIIALLVCFSCFYIQNLNAQASSKLFKTHGYNVQYSKVAYEAPSFGGGLRANDVNFLGFGYSFNLRYSLTELSDDSSIGLSAGLLAALDYAFSLDGTDGSYGGLYLPVHVNYNIGAGATYDTDKNFGFGIGVGMTPSYMPLSGGGDISKLRLSPSAQIALRFWAAGTNALNEYFLRFDKLPGVSDAIPGEKPFSFTFAAGITRYIGY